MTEHPAAPTPEDETWIDLTIAMRAYMQDRNGWGAVEDAMRARDDFHRAEARAAARKEVIAIIEALPIMAAQHSCWDDHEGGPNGPHADGTPCRDRVLWEAVDRRAILDSLSTDTREDER